MRSHTKRRRGPGSADYWTPERRAAVAARWTDERRAAASARGRAAWRARNPDKAARRDEILAATAPSPCSRCISDESKLFVTDYKMGAVVWLCRVCAKQGREDFTLATRGMEAEDAGTQADGRTVHTDSPPARRSRARESFELAISSVADVRDIELARAAPSMASSQVPDSQPIDAWERAIIDLLVEASLRRRHVASDGRPCHRVATARKPQISEQG